MKFASRATSPFARLLPQLNPDLALRRGFARVLGGQGQTVKSAAAAAREPALTLKFADADLAVVPGASRSRIARPVPSPVRATVKQGDLF